MSKRSNVLLISLAFIVTITLLTMGSSVSDTTSGYDRHTPEECADCHYGGGAKLQPAVVAEWEQSSHANSYQGYNGNTYCAQCHSPLEADPDATHSDNEAIAQSDWQGVTCYSCHTPRIVENGVVTLGHELGIYIVGSGNPETATTAEEALAMYDLVEEADEVCTHCHTGMRHEVTFKPGFGRQMYKSGVTCLDCHMPEVPTEDFRDHRSHTWHVDDTYSCGIERSDCHDNKDADWAAKQIGKDNIHKIGVDSDANHPWQDKPDK